MRMARVLGAVGRVLIAAGVLILLFVAYQLWGTGIRTAQAQNQLEDDFQEALEQVEPTTTTTTTPGATTTTTLPETAPPTAPVPEGEATARIQIPAIGVDKIVVEGVALPDLKKGPGHYPQTPLPGQEGNAAIAGHRTTYGAPFNRIDELEPGDEIIVTTVQGEFTYVVSETLIVAPSEVQVLDDKGDDRLTLSACHPKYSARQRIVVVSILAPEEHPLPRPTRAVDAPPPKTVDSIDGERGSKTPAIFWGLVCALIWFLAWLVGRKWRKWPCYLIGFPFFMVALYFFFEEFSRLLPSNF
ncbi:MAG: class E sortase [Acidimicrobiales bacterium]